MSNDFEDDFGEAFFSSGVETPQAERPYGLIVPIKARVVRDAAGEIWDELSEIERAYRTAGRPVIEFEESDDEPPDGQPITVGPP